MFGSDGITKDRHDYTIKELQDYTEGCLWCSATMGMSINNVLHHIGECNSPLLSFYRRRQRELTSKNKAEKRDSAQWAAGCAGEATQGGSRCESACGSAAEPKRSVARSSPIVAEEREKSRQPQKEKNYMPVMQSPTWNGRMFSGPAPALKVLLIW